MANPLKGEVQAEIEGITYTIKLSYNALCDVEKELGAITPAILKDVQAGSWAATRALFAAGLRHSMPGMTEARAGDLIQAFGLGKALATITEAMTAAFGSGEKEAEAPPQ